jgi:ATP-dependent DNA helicase RecQ
VELTALGLQVLKTRTPVHLTTRPERLDRVETRPRGQRAGEIECDEILFERLRALRREIAEAMGVPPYIVFTDVSLRCMARDTPITENSFSNVTGVGQQKLERFGAQFMDAIVKYLRETGRKV